MPLQKFKPEPYHHKGDSFEVTMKVGGIEYEIDHLCALCGEKLIKHYSANLCACPIQSNVEQINNNMREDINVKQTN